MEADGEQTNGILLSQNFGQDVRTNLAEEPDISAAFQSSLQIMDPIEMVFSKLNHIEAKIVAEVETMKEQTQILNETVKQNTVCIQQIGSIVVGIQLEQQKQSNKEGDKCASTQSILTSFEELRNTVSRLCRRIDEVGDPKRPDNSKTSRNPPPYQETRVASTFQVPQPSTSYTTSVTHTYPS